MNNSANEMRKAGALASSLIVQSCESARDEINAAVAEVQSLALRITDDAQAFTESLMKIGEEHAQRIEDATARLSELIGVIDEQKRAVASLSVTTPSEAVQQREQLQLPPAPLLAHHEHEGKANGYG